jgi:hypothetical protein
LVFIGVRLHHFKRIESGLIGLIKCSDANSVGPLKVESLNVNVPPFNPPGLIATAGGVTDIEIAAGGYYVPLQRKGSYFSARDVETIQRGFHVPRVKELNPLIFFFQVDPGDDHGVPLVNRSVAHYFGNNQTLTSGILGTLSFKTLRNC